MMVRFQSSFLLIAVLGMVLGLGSQEAGAQDLGPISEKAFVRDSGWNNNYSKGQALFQENCADCHGEHGKGGLGLPLNLQSFLVIADTGYLLRSMQYGRPFRAMPAFEEDMSLDDMKNIALYIKSWQYQPSLKVPAGRIKGDAEQGAKIFQGLCTGCHGLKGEGGPNAGGGHVIGAVSGIGGPALADPGFLKSATDGYIKATLMFGRVGTPMGAYLKGRQGFVELHEYEINDIVAYLRGLEPKE
jgi:cytochrome c oxidase cbb3-type subunit III